MVGRFDGNILDGQYVRLVDFTVDPPHCISWKDPWTYFLCFAHPEPFPQLANTDLATDPEIPDNFPNFELPRSRNEITHVTDPYADSDYETEMLQVDNNPNNPINCFEDVNDEFCNSFLNF